MRKIIALLLIIMLCLLSVSCNNSSTNATNDINDTTCSATSVDGHSDANNDKLCDACSISVITTFDFYAINDLHGKFTDTENTVGVEGLTTYLKTSAALDDNPIFLSSGDMWQGGGYSNITKGKIITDWMNALGFASMTLGNHEFDWGEEYIIENEKLASFPMLAINIYEKSTNKQVEYCQSSVMIECNGLQVGIIGAAGDNYSSISSDKVEDVYFKTGSQLTALVKAESQKLRNEGADIIVYSLHDGYSQSTSDKTISNSALSSYYDISLSNGYVDIVFEGHTHRSYAVADSQSVYHLQNSGDNGGISHAELEYNFANGNYTVTQAEHIPSTKYRDLEDDAIIAEILEKHKESVAKADTVVGQNDIQRDKDSLRSIIAQLYFNAGNERWGDKYDIVLGGGFMTVRSPGYLRYGILTYADLEAILPFDNKIVLCSIKGRDLSSKFVNTSNSNYFVYYGEYGKTVRESIDYDATYYVIVDTYTALYAPNKLTIVEEYDDNVFARDLLANHIKAGNLIVK